MFIAEFRHVLVYFVVLKLTFPEAEVAALIYFSKQVLLKFRKIHRKTPVLKSLFNKVAGLGCNFVRKRLQKRCFRVIIAKFLRTAFFIEHLQWLLPQEKICGLKFTNTNKFLLGQFQLDANLTYITSQVYFPAANQMSQVNNKIITVTSSDVLISRLLTLN